jgi:Lrp/AsnC family transcriptional regulator, leucine-responsive regulatory protein
MDDTNRRLLALLRQDARTRYAELGKSIHLSPPAVFERVKKLEKSGVVRRYTVELDPSRLGLELCAFVQIGTTDRSCEHFAQTMSDYPEIEECHSIAGEDCILVKVRTANTEALNELLQKIRQIPGVQKTVTTVVLKTYFERGVQVAGTT